MPLCMIYLLSLSPQTTLPSFLQTLSTTSLTPLIISKIIRWIILPTHLSTTSLLSQNIHWDILLITPTTSPLPTKLLPLTSHKWSITAGIPQRLLENFAEKNQRLLSPREGDIPPLSKPSGSQKHGNVGSAQNLELSDELRAWVEDFGRCPEGKGAVSMLNLLAFKPGMREEYLKYGSEFAKSVGSSRGGLAKLVGSVVELGGEGEGEGGRGWDEFALAHYPSIRHFEDMLVGEDYQVVNRKYRVPSLRDTCILCTSEVGLGVEVGKGGGEELKGKL